VKYRLAAGFLVAASWSSAIAGAARKVGLARTSAIAGRRVKIRVKIMNDEMLGTEQR